MEDINKTIHLKCNCEDHILQVNCNLEYKGPNNEMYDQEWFCSIFKADRINKPSLFQRIGVAINYLIKGTMHKDQIILSNDEADKLSKFIEENNYSKCIK